MTKAQERKANLEKHYQTLEKLAIETGGKITNGKKLSNMLRSLENKAYNANLDYCNKEDFDNEKYDVFLQKVANSVLTLFPNIKNFIVNRDPRGYALKVKPNTYDFLHRDFGGYGILSPEY